MATSLVEQLQLRLSEGRSRSDINAADARRATILDDSALRMAEEQLGFDLPPTLASIYLKVGNGGFGPGGGLLPLLRPTQAGGDETAVEMYLAFRQSDPADPMWIWPPLLLPFCDWGCAIRSCIDCSSERGPIVTFEPGLREPGGEMSESLAQTHDSLEAWFADWFAGKNLWEAMFEPDPARAMQITNPFTRGPMTVRPRKFRRLPRGE